LTRYRIKLVATRTATRNRTIKLLETAGIKLSSVVSDAFGKTGRAILDGLAEGKATPADLAACAKGVLRNKMPELERALQHRLSNDQRELLVMLLQAYDSTDALIAQVELKLAVRMESHAATIAKLDPIPGINPLAAITLLAETGFDMSAFRNDAHLTALAGLAPGNAISSDKRRRISVRKGNHYLKRICVQIAWAASRKKDSFLRLRFLRLKARIGQNKAIVAVARQILVLIFHVLSTDRPYTDLGPNFYDKNDPAKTVLRLTRRLDALGFAVELTKKSQV
jgi:transposase